MSVERLRPVDESGDRLLLRDVHAYGDDPARIVAFQPVGLPPEVLLLQVAHEDGLRALREQALGDPQADARSGPGHHRDLVLVISAHVLVPFPFLTATFSNRRR